MRNAKQFLQAITKSVKADPTLPVRFDIVNEEQEQIKKAFAVLTAAVTDRNAARSSWDWQVCTSLHADPAQREKGFGRVAFFGPDCPRAKTETERYAACYSPSEIERIFYANAHEVRWLEPDAKRGKNALATLRANARPGGLKRAHYTHREIESALKRFKGDNATKTKTVWDAAAALIRSGKELDDYKTVDGVWKAIGRIADGLGITREEWYGDI